MQSQFYVSHGEEQLGPWTVTQIVEKLSLGEVSTLDYLYDEAKKDWILVVEHPQMLEALKSQKPVAPSIKPPKKMPEKEVVAEAVSEERPSEEWFVLKWENRYGPFEYEEVIKMLQEKTVFEFDFVWKTGMESWVRIAELDDFKPGRIRSLQSSGGPKLAEVFFRRRHMRTSFNGSIIVHDNNSVWKGKSVEISEGGAGLVMHNSMVLPGQKLYLHFKPGDSVPPFNAVCEVVSKRFIKGVKSSEAPVSYGVKFVDIETSTQEEIRRHVADTVNKAA